MTHSARRINFLAKELPIASYLEIGVNQAETFRQVLIKSRVGVDPNFRFDPDSVRDDNTELNSETSDEYFAHIRHDKKFDLIFIDGLHTFEQVVRDLSNAILHTHDNSIIIIDDTRPSDVFSAMPNQEETAFFRKMFNSDSKDWHGDVFKIIPYIHDFWPSLNYRTISSGGNPQTIVWRSSAFHRKPFKNDLEAISRFTFFDLQRRLELLRLKLEEDALNECIAEIRKHSLASR